MRMACTDEGEEVGGAAAGSEDAEEHAQKPLLVEHAHRHRAALAEASKDNISHNHKGFYTHILLQIETSNIYFHVYLQIMCEH